MNLENHHYHDDEVEATSQPQSNETISGKESLLGKRKHEETSVAIHVHMADSKTEAKINQELEELKEGAP
jgi:hypothetical protein